MQLDLFETLKKVKENPTKENMFEFFWIATNSTRAGRSLSLEQIKEIFNEVYEQT
jgi:hypothetical protein